MTVLPTARQEEVCVLLHRFAGKGHPLLGLELATNPALQR